MKIFPNHKGATAQCNTLTQKRKDSPLYNFSLIQFNVKDEIKSKFSTSKNKLKPNKNMAVHTLYALYEQK